MTDNAPLKHILCPDKGIPVIASQRLQHWAFILEAYQYKIVHKRGELMAHVDALSRLPSVDVLEESAFAVDIMPNNFPLNSSLIASETCKDKILTQVKYYVVQGWPSHNVLSHQYSRYFDLRYHLSVDSNCLMYGSAVVIPESLQAKVLDILHEGHPGVVRFRMLAKNVCWWLTINSDIDTKCKLCNACAVVNFRPVKEFIPWPRPKSPFERIHMDFFHYQQVCCLVVIDAYSKWVHVAEMSAGTAAPAVILELRKIFALFGDPRKIVADNGPPFNSLAFKEFCTSKDIVLSNSPVYHPESNGLAERSVQHVKRSLEKIFLPVKLPVSDLILSFLYTYRNTPSTATGKSPNDMLLSFRPCTSVSRLNPKNHVSPSNNFPYREGDKVLVRFSPKHPVVSGIVVRPLGGSLVLVSIAGVMRPLHLNQLSLTA